MYVKIKQTHIIPANYAVGKTGKQPFLKIMGTKTGLSRFKSPLHFFFVSLVRVGG